MRTPARYEAVLDLLSGYLNGYGHEYLSASEAARFERSYNAEGEAHREFCELFGAEKIVGSLDNFLGYYMIRWPVRRRRAPRKNVLWTPCCRPCQDRG